MTVSHPQETVCRSRSRHHTQHPMVPSNRRHASHPVLVKWAAPCLSHDDIRLPQKSGFSMQDKASAISWTSDSGTQERAQD